MMRNETQCIWIGCSTFWLLQVESSDFSLAEKERTAACKAEQIYKITTIYTQKDNIGPFWVKIVFLWIFSALQPVLSFSIWEKSRDSTRNSSSKPPQMYWTQYMWCVRLDIHGSSSSLIFYELPFFVYFLAPKVSYGREGKLKSEKN